MIAFGSTIKIFLSTRPIDMRKAFDGLCGEVISFLCEEPTSGNLFAFTNKQRDRIKILYWDRHGFWLLYKRLEQGRFQMPDIHDTNSPAWSLAYDQLTMILEGIDLHAHRRKRYIHHQIT